MSTQRCGAAACDGQQHLFVLAVNPLADCAQQRTVLHSERCRPPPGEAGSCALRLLSFYSDGECIQRAAGGAEMPPGEVQIDRGFLQVAMPQQHLDGSQVGTGFEQMCGKAVAQSVGMDALVLKTG